MSDLQRLLEKLQGRSVAGRPPHEREEIIRNWRRNLENLFNEIRLWLTPLTENGVISIQDQSRQIIEEGLGAYDVPMLIITPAGSPPLQIEPIARLVIGAQGRVDIKSGSRLLTLLRTFDDDGWVLLAKGAVGGPQFPKFDQNMLFSIIDELT